MVIVLKCLITLEPLILSIWFLRFLVESHIFGVYDAGDHTIRFCSIDLEGNSCSFFGQMSSGQTTCVVQWKTYFSKSCWKWLQCLCVLVISTGKMWTNSDGGLKTFKYTSKVLTGKFIHSQTKQVPTLGPEVFQTESKWIVALDVDC